MYTIEDFEKLSKEEFKDLLFKAADHYYNNSESIMSDEDFDKAIILYVKKFNETFKSIGSPVKVTEWQKAIHKIAMTSLNKVNTKEEFNKWALGIGDEHYVIMDKLDGISIDLEYESGNLVKAITRGDGIEGEDILNNVIKMKNVQQKIAKFTGSLRGEVVMFVTDFERLNEDLMNRGEKEMANPRNGASGIAKRFDGNNSQYLTILYYDVTGDWKTEEEKLLWFKPIGLKTCFWVKVNIEQCIEYYNQYEKILRAETPYDIDGLVVKANSIKLQKQHGMLGDNPKAQVAWKFTSMKAETEVEGIEWSHGQNMRITPVALLKPVKIGGVVVKRASLHNMEMFHALNLGNGDKVLISRRNDVIPYVESVIEHVRHIKFKSPLSCPLCNEELIEDDKFLMCQNTECQGLRLGNLGKWVKALDVNDISDKTIELLESVGMIKDPSDFYKLDINAIANLEGMGIRSATKIVENFNNKKEIDLETFIDGLNIPNFAGSRARIIIKDGIDTLNKMLEVNEKQLVQIKGIGSEVANAIVYGLSAKKHVIKKLLDVITIIKPEEPKEIVMSSDLMKGEVVVFTGAIQRVDERGERFTRKILQGLVYENGGNCEDSVKKGVTMLVQADPSSQSSKTKKANDLGIDIISEANFFKMIGM